MSPNALTTILSVALGALITLSAWSVKTLLELKVVLVGLNGDAGLQRRVDSLSARVSRLERHIGPTARHTESEL